MPYYDVEADGKNVWYDTVRHRGCGTGAVRGLYGIVRNRDDRISYRTVRAGTAHSSTVVSYIVPVAGRTVSYRYV